MEEKARILVVSPNEDLIHEIAGEFDQYCVEGASQEGFEAIVAQDERSWEIVILDFTLNGVSEDLLDQALNLGSKPMVVTLVDLVDERKVEDESVNWPIGIWSFVHGACCFIPMDRLFANPLNLLKLQIPLILATYQLRREKEAKGPLLDDDEIFRLLQLMHCCRGGDQALLDRKIKIKWTQFHPLAKISDRFEDIEELQGTITLGIEDAVDFPLRTNVPSLIVVREDGVKVVIPYNAFLVKGIEVIIELPD